MALAMLPMHPLDVLFGLDSPLFGAEACRRRHRRPCKAARHGSRVVEMGRGLVIEAEVPGLSADNCTVEVVPIEGRRHELRVHAEPHFTNTRLLPAEADVAAAQASVIDGVLRVTVPRRAAETLDVPVGAEPLPASDENGDDDDAMKDDDDDDTAVDFKLGVPGTAAHDVVVRVQPGAGRQLLTVKAGDRREATYELPEHALVRDASAACVNGLLHVRVPLKPATVVPVTAEPLAEDLDLVLTASLPGLSASDVRVVADGRGVLRATLHDGRTVRAVRLPRGADASAAVASMLHGVLKVGVPKPAGAGSDQQERATAAVAVPLSATQRAELPDEDATEEQWTHL